MKKDKELQPKYFGAMFTKFYNEFAENHPGITQQRFGNLFNPPISRQTITSWKKGSIPESYNLEQILNIFGKTVDDFIPQSNADKYSFDTDRQTEVATETLLPFCEKIGLDTDFIKLARKLLGPKFDELFPIWSPIQLVNNQYIRRGHEALASAAQMIDAEFLQIVVNADNKTKTVDLTLTDLLFLKDLQDRVTDTIVFEFMRRSQELKREVDDINEAAADSVEITPDGKTILRNIDLFEFDDYSRRVKRVLRRK